MTGIGRRAYIGSFTSAGGRGVTVAETDPGTGALRELGHSDAVADPSYLALTPDGRALCAVGERSDGVVGVFSLADPDRPALRGPMVSVRGDSPTHLAVTTRRVYTANYGSGSVSSVLLADGTGAAADSAVVTAHQGSGPVTERQEGPHAHAVLVDPTSTWLLATDLGTDAVWIYALDPADGSQRPHGRLPLRAGTGPRHLVFHPDGVQVYVINELEPVLTHCRWDTATGRLTVLGETPVLPAGTTGENYPSGLVVSPDGTRLYAGVRGGNRVAVLELAAADGAPGLLDTVDCGGDWPRAVALHPDGRHLYVANERSGDVSWFDLPDGGGLPRHAGTMAAPAASCVVFR